MQTRLVPEDQWVEFCNQFSRDHLGWPATIEVLDPETGPRHIARDLPLSGISFDTKGTRPGSLEISAGDDPDCQVSHVVDRPLYIREIEESSGSVDLQIEPGVGPATLVHLRGPMH